MNFLEISHMMNFLEISPSLPASIATIGASGDKMPRGKGRKRSNARKKVPFGGYGDNKVQVVSASPMESHQTKIGGS